ncbi:MAG: sugar ABC transporter permease [Nocardioidaceae bacterium]
MATTAPEQGPLEEAAEAVRDDGLGAGVMILFKTGRSRISSGELGALPVIVGLAVIWTYFQSQDSHFLTPRNLSNLLLQIAVVGTIAIGLVLVLLLGEIDLSVGSVAGVCAATLGVLVVSHNWPWWAAIVAMLLVGAAIGAIQGAWFAVVGVPSFIVTLAGLLGWQGLQLHVLGSTGTINVFESHISAIATTFLPGFWGWALAIGCAAAYAAAHVTEERRRRAAGLPSTQIAVVALRTLATAALLLGAVAVLNRASGVPTAALILLALVILFSLITTKTKFGRYIYAVGGNAEAARRAGINLRGIRICAFTLASTFAALGGLIQVSRGAAASTQTGGGTLLLEAIASAVIGGTSLFGGRGNVWSALLGALVIGSVSNGLDLIGQPADVKLMVEGGILLLAVTIDAASRRGRASAGRV